MSFAGVVCCLLQAPLIAALMEAAVWEDWAAAWVDQAERATLYSAVTLPGGTQVNSYRYLKSRTRDGTRVWVRFPGVERSASVEEQRACEVVVFVEVWQGSVMGLESSTPAGMFSSSSSGRLARFAVVHQYNTVVRTDQPQLARQLLEAKAGDYLPGLHVVPLSQIVAALHAHFSVREGVEWIQFPVAGGRSSQQVFGLRA